ncbi:MAG: TatD family hydrolase [bacterium]|nr:TatD family hydrolase [bacterium]
MIIDSHCHIHDQDFPFSKEEVFENMREMGVCAALCIGVNVENSARAVEFCKENSNEEIQLFAAVGIHPHEAESVDIERDMPILRNLTKNQNVVAVGEIGLDYFYENSPREAQEKVLWEQLKIAFEADLPVSFHVRNAFDDFWQILDNFEEEYGQIRGVLHSFTDSEENLSRALERGFYIGVNGISTFVKEKELLKMFEKAPLDRILLETDAPYLAPQGKRGKKNQPAWTALVAQDLATKRAVNQEEIAKITTQNTLKLFSIDKNALL